jgi:hypothetical protein
VIAERAFARNTFLIAKRSIIVSVLSSFSDLRGPAPAAAGSP